MKNIIKLTLSLLLFAYACESGHKFTEKLPELPKVNVKFRGTVNDHYIFNYPRNMFLTDSLIIIHNADETSFCQIFDKNTGRHLGSYFKKGQGPFEITSSSCLTYNKKDKIVSILDENTCKIVYFKIDNLDKPNYKEIDLTNSHEGNYRIGNILQINPDKYFTLGNTSKCRFGLLKNRNADGIENLDIDYPKVVDDEEINQAIFTYLPKWEMKPDNTKFIIATHIGLIFEIFNVKDDKLTPHKIKYLFEPIYKVVDSTNPKWITSEEHTRNGVMEMYTTNDYIFCVIEGMFKDDDEMPEFTSIFALDWDGNFLKEYKFPKGVLPYCFAVDEESKMFYCITMNADTELSFNKYSF